MHTEPVFLGSAATPTHQGVACSTLDITFKDSMRVSSSLTFPLIEYGTLHGVKMACGLASGSKSISYG